MRHLFLKTKFTLETAEDWLRDNGYYGWFRVDSDDLYYIITKKDVDSELTNLLENIVLE